MLFSRSLISGVAMALATSAWMRSIAAPGVPAGMNQPCQPADPDGLALVFVPHPQAGQAASGLQLLVGSGVAFVLGYISIAWLLKFVSNHSFAWFAAYRIPLGVIVMIRAVC